MVRCGAIVVLVFLLVALLPFGVSAGTGSIEVEAPGYYDEYGIFDLYFENVVKGDVVYWWWTSGGFLDFCIMDPEGTYLEERVDQTGSTGQFVAEFSGTYHFIFKNSGDQNVAVDYDAHFVPMADETAETLVWTGIIVIIIAVVVVVLIIAVIKKKPALTHTAQTSPVQPQPVASGVCRQCNTTNAPNASFCNGCGGPLQ